MRTSAAWEAPSTDWTPRRRELRDWFRENAPSLAPAYEGAVELLGQTALPGRIHFIAHVVRDLANRLVFALDPELNGTQVQYAKHLDKIEPEWPSIDDTFKNTEIPPPDTVSIPFSVVREMNELVLSHRTQKDAPDPYDLLFEWFSRQDPTQVRANPRIVSTFKRTRSWFMSKTHLRPSAAVTIDEAELQRHFELFEDTLHSFVGSFFTGTQELDDILQHANQ